MNVDNTAGVTGSPVLGAVAAYFDCAVVMACECGDHSVYMGDVLAADADPAKSPLWYFDRGYRRMDPAGTSANLWISTRTALATHRS